MTTTAHATQASVRSLYIEDLDGVVVTCEPALDPTDGFQQVGAESNVLVSLDRHSSGMSAELTPVQARELYRHLGMLIAVLDATAGG